MPTEKCGAWFIVELSTALLTCYKINKRLLVSEAKTIPVIFRFTMKMRLSPRHYWFLNSQNHSELFFHYLGNPFPNLFILPFPQVCIERLLRCLFRSEGSYYRQFYFAYSFADLVAAYVSRVQPFKSFLSPLTRPGWYLYTTSAGTSCLNGFHPTRVQPWTCCL